MLGRRVRDQTELLMAGSLRDLIPDEHILARVDRVLDLSWLRAEVRHLYASDGAGRPGIDPEAAVRLMLAGFLLGLIHDRRLLREAQVNIAIRWFAGYGLNLKRLAAALLACFGPRLAVPILLGLFGALLSLGMQSKPARLGTPAPA